VEQNYRAIETALRHSVPRKPLRWLGDDRKKQGRERLTALLKGAGLEPKGPVIGIHPGAGRRIKEWPIERFAELAQRLVKEKAATIVLTGSAAESDKTDSIRKASAGASLDLAGKLNLSELAETMSAFHTFVSCDTSAMHFACALGVPSVSIFGPSDPGRYFSGGDQGFLSRGPHVVLAPNLWCSPCNLIRRPPEECDSVPTPECLIQMTTLGVFEATAGVLEASANLERP
jgi:ADP-heptose:LPS heptosyltransferase